MSLTTKRALAESLKRLLAKRSFDKITVKDIVEDCGVNRQTFYYHFHDIYDLMEWIFQDAAETVIAQKLDYSDWTAGLKSLMDYLKENRTLVLNAYNSISHEVVSDYIKRTLRPYVSTMIHSQAAELKRPVSEEDMAFIVDLFTLSAAGFIMEWIGRQMKPGDTDWRLERFRAAIDGSLQVILRNLSELDGRK